MSSTIDNRVVEMRFDNRQFESNVQTSMSTLEKLKQSLNFKNASKGLDDLNAASKNVNMAGLGTAVEAVSAKFSALQVMGVTALANITNSAVNTGKRIASALTIDPIKTGFNEYETKINSVQTIMSNTASKGSQMSDVTRVLDELNTYADKTIYNFAEMTRNIGTFTAAGVGLEDSAAAIQGIANLAAASGSNSQQASTAMYQLSQALATGTVKLMDWNSVVNAGMGGEKFQEALKQTAREHGVAVDGIIEKNGSFRDSLQEGWLSADILNTTLKKFTTEGAQEYAKSMMESGKWTQEQADALMKEAQAMEDAATKVKTFTQLWDTLKESAQSGWAQSWEIIIGDFTEAKELLTEISETIGGVLSKSSDARNKVLQEWKDLGGRTAVVEALRNTFEGIASIVKPISEAFKEIFPPITAQQLLAFSEGLRDLTAKLKISESTANNLKSTFKGVFSVFDIGIEAVKAVAKGIGTLLGQFTGLTGGIIGVTGSFGDFLSNIRDTVVETDFFGTAVGKVVDILSKGITKIKDFGKSLMESFDTPNFDGFLGFFEGLWNIVTQVSSKIVEAVSSVGKGIAAAFGDTSFFDVLNNGLFAGILFAVQRFVSGLSDPFEGVSGLFENVTGILDDVRGCFKAFQDQLHAGTLLKIASAIGILAAALFVISTIDADSMGKALGAITVLFAELMGAMFIFGKIVPASFLSVLKMSSLMKNMKNLGVAVLILAGAMKVLSTIDTEGIVKGLVAIGVLMGELAIFLSVAKFDGKMISTSTGILILASAMLVLAKAVGQFGSMNWADIGKGLTSVGVLLAEIALFTNLTGNAKHVVATGAAMVLLGASMKIFASALSDFGAMSWSEIGKGLTAMAGALAAITIAMNLMPKNMISTGAGLVVVGAALEILVDVLGKMGGLSWDQITKGLVTIGVALAELSIGLNFMTGTLAGSAALLVAAGALAIMAPVMKTLGSMSWSGIAKSLITLAGAFTVIGVAGLLLTPLVPTLLGLAGTFALFGIATLGIGTGLALIGVGLTATATGITALAGSVAVGATAIVAGLTVIITGLLQLIPTIAEKLGEGIVAFSKVIGESAPILADSFLKLIAGVLQSLATYTPQIVNSLLNFFIGLINSLADHVPTLIVAVVNFVGKIFEGVVTALKGINTESLFKGILAVGLMSGLIVALSSITGFIPGAMLGVLGIGAVIAELALVLAAIGGLAQIPGLEWLIQEGGDFLQKIGTAIGQFVGGIVGGFASGFSSSLPQIGSDLANFMTNVQPFIEGAKSIDNSVLKGVTSLGKAILAITAADLLNSIGSWFTGGNSMVDFANQLVPFGEGMKAYSDAVSGIDTASITSSAKAVKALAKVGDSIGNTGGLVSLFTGDNDLATFGTQLIPFGKSIKSYSEAVSGIDSEAILASATAAKALAKVGDNIQNSGGLVSLFTGDNDLSTFANQLVPFGKSIKKYSEAVSGIDIGAITSSVTAAKALSKLGNSLTENSGGLVSLFTGDNTLSSLGYQLVPFGYGMKEYANVVAGIDTESIIASANAAKALVKVGDSLSNSGGLVSLFTGDNNLSTFGVQLVPFGIGMKQYSEAVAGIDVESIIASANAAKALAGVGTSLSNSGGLVSLFTGDNSLSSLGYQLVPFGNGMKLYSEAVSGINSEAILASVEAAKGLASVGNSLANSGGLVTLFTGDNNLAMLGTQLVPFGIGMKQYSEAVTGIDAEAITASSNAAKALADVANSLSNSGGLVSLFTGDNNLSSFGEQLVPFGKGMKSYANAVADMNTEAITNSVGGAKALVKIANSLSESGGLAGLMTGDSNLGALGNQLVPFGKGMKDYANAVAELDTGAITNSVASAQKLVSLVNSMTNINVSGANSFREAINSLAQTNVDAFVKAFSSSTADLSSVGTKMIDSLIQGIKSGQATLQSQASSMMESTLKAISSKEGAFTTAGSQLMTKFVSGIKDKSSSVSSAAVSSLDGALISLRGYYDGFYSAGSYVASGLANGMRAQTSSVQAAAASLAAAAEAATRAKLMINSPSKVFYKIASSIGEGIVNSLHDSRPSVYRSSAELAEYAKRGLSGAIGRVYDLLNSDVDMQPTIRPVIDLSDIKAGANTIDGLFGNNASIGVSANIGAISSMMRQRNQNGGSDEIVSAINKLRNELGNVGNTTYAVNGVTYDDGSNVADAIESLIRAAVIERRV